MVVLHEININPELSKYGFVPNFSKEASVVAESTWGQNHDSVQRCLFNLQNQSPYRIAWEMYQRRNAKSPVISQLAAEYRFPSRF